MSQQGADVNIVRSLLQCKMQKLKAGRQVQCGAGRGVPGMFRRIAAAACLAVLPFVPDASAGNAPMGLMAAEPNDAGIKVTVPTGGCTKKADFAVSSHPVQGGAAQIEFKRLKPDDCKGYFPDGLKLLFTWDDLKLPAGTKLTVANPIGDQAVQPEPVRKAAAKVHKKSRKKCKRSKKGKHHCKVRRARHARHKAAAKKAHHHHHRQRAQPGSWQ